MQFYKEKQTARLTFVGKDDLLKNDATASLLLNGSIKRRMEFYINNMPEFSPNAKMIIESISLPKIPSNSLIKIRCNNLNNYNNFDSSGKTTSPVLVWSGSPDSDTNIWNNSSSKSYIYPVSRNIIQSTKMSFDIEVDDGITGGSSTTATSVYPLVQYKFLETPVNTGTVVDSGIISGGTTNMPLTVVCTGSTTALVNDFPTIIDNGVTKAYADVPFISGSTYYYAFTQGTNNSIYFPANATCDILIVGGGGSGRAGKGGGSSGGLLYCTGETIPSDTYYIVVGGGGTNGNGEMSLAFGATAKGGMRADESGTGATNNGINTPGTTVAVWDKDLGALAGGTVYAFSYYVFTASDSIAFSADTVCDVLVVGGGGGGSAGGGGGGQFLTASDQTFSTGITYTITVGLGGTGAIEGNGAGQGESSKISNGATDIFKAFGGGGGGGNDFPAPTHTSGEVGSFGGQGHDENTAQIAATHASLFGNRGGKSSANTAGGGGGGGGSGASGSDSSSSIGGVGGVGSYSLITGVQIGYSGGGTAGANINGSGTDANTNNTNYGGGGGSRSVGGIGSSGTPNTGGGGGGGDWERTSGTSGGSGIVIIRVLTTAVASITTSVSATSVSTPSGGGGIGSVGAPSTSSASTPNGGSGVVVPIRTAGELFAGGGGANGGTRVPSDKTIGYGGNSTSGAGANGGNGIVIVRFTINSTVATNTPTIMNSSTTGWLGTAIPSTIDKYFEFNNYTANTNTIAFPIDTVCDVFMIGGGGPGGYNSAGGGGAGAYYRGNYTFSANTTYTLNVAGPKINALNNGNDTVIKQGSTTVLVVKGGGYGGTFNSPESPASSGGCGGGAYACGANGVYGTYAGASGLAVTGTYLNFGGNSGGSGKSSASQFSGGGGGGCGGAGGDGAANFTNNTGGLGGLGVVINITGTDVGYGAGGGGGGGNGGDPLIAGNTSTTDFTNGSGGWVTIGGVNIVIGGTASRGGSAVVEPVANSGSGGGAGYTNGDPDIYPGRGASGKIILRWSTANYLTPIPSLPINIISRITGLATGSYSFQSGYLFNGNTASATDDCFLNNTVSANVNALMNSLEVAKGFSIHFVFKTDSLVASEAQPIFYAGNGTQQIAVYLSTTNYLTFQINNQTVSYLLADGLYHIYDMTCDIGLLSANVKLYVDGILRSSLSIVLSGSLITNPTPTGYTYQIGRIPSVVGTDLSKGVIQDFRIYNIVLTESNIASLQSGTSPLLKYTTVTSGGGISSYMAGNLDNIMMSIVIYDDE